MGNAPSYSLEHKLDACEARSYFEALSFYPPLLGLLWNVACKAAVLLAIGDMNCISLT